MTRKLIGAAALATIIGLALGCALLLLTREARASDSEKVVFTAQGTDTSVYVDARGYNSAIVTIWAASGSPNGSVVVYKDDGSDAPLVEHGRYATPSTAKAFVCYPLGRGMRFVLTGNSTGTVGTKVVLK